MSIEARLTKTCDAFTLDIQISVPPGITVLFGPSGSGKTLTLNCIAGFAAAEEGRVLLNDRLCFDAAARVNVPPQIRRCGYLFQDHALFPHMTVRENIGFAVAGRTLEKRRKVNEVVDALGLGDLIDRKPGQLSGGQKQRAALARTLASEPQVLLLDEPTRGLDIRLKQSFYEVLRQLTMPMLLVTHDLEECFELAQQVCLIHQGRILQAATKEVLLQRPATVEAAHLLGIFCLVDAEILSLDPVRNASRIRIGANEFEGTYYPGHLIGDRGVACIRQAEITAVAPGAARSRSRSRVLAATQQARGVRLQFENRLSATLSGTQYEDLRDHDELEISVPPSAITFLNP